MEDCKKLSYSSRIGCNLMSSVRLISSIISLNPIKSLKETFVFNYVRQMYYANADKVEVNFDHLNNLELNYDCTDCVSYVRIRDQLLHVIIAAIKASSNSFFHRTLENSIALSTQRAINSHINKRLRPYFKPIPSCINDNGIVSHPIVVKNKD